MQTQNLSLGRLYILPSPVFELDIRQISPYQKEIMESLQHFAVEHIKPARRFIRRLIHDKNIDECQFYFFGKHDDQEKEAQTAIQHLKSGISVGLLSDAGAPGIADPGSILVKKAHQSNIAVEPIFGPSSIMAAIMASGMNGQHFHFHGYLPAKPDAVAKKLKQLEIESLKNHSAQIFIETPYRNKQIVEQCKKQLSKNTHLCIACDLGSPDGFVHTKRIKDWDMPDFHKRPTVFLVQAEL